MGISANSYKTAATVLIVLKFIINNPGSPRSKIVVLTGLDYTTVTRCINTLLDEGLIEKSKSSTNKNPGRPIEHYYSLVSFN